MGGGLVGKERVAGCFLSPRCVVVEVDAVVDVLHHRCRQLHSSTIGFPGGDFFFDALILVVRNMIFPASSFLVH